MFVEKYEEIQINQKEKNMTEEEVKKYKKMGISDEKIASAEKERKAIKEILGILIGLSCGTAGYILDQVEDKISTVNRFTIIDQSIFDIKTREGN